jgi:hypothetical protein
MLAMLAESALRSLVVGGVVWAGLNLLRVRNPHVHMTSWLMVLVASLSMPLLMHCMTLTITVAPAPVAAGDLWPLDTPLPQPLHSSLPSEFGVGAAHGQSYPAFSWRVFALSIYVMVAGLLLLRLAMGIYLTWRLARTARPLLEPWAAAADVRVSDAVRGPVTFGSAILLPSQYIEWDVLKRQAVLAHEGAHVVHGDFYVLLLASLNRAVFWFSPFAWWQLIRLAELAEITSDARALEVFEDRLSYAEILLDLVQQVRPAPVGLEMARACTVRARIERILDDAVAPAQAGWRKRIWTAAAVAPIVVVAAGSIAYRTAPGSAPVLAGDEAMMATAVHKSEVAGFYPLGPGSIFALFRAGEDLYGQLTWQRRLRLTLEPDGTYSYPAASGRITFAAAEGQPPHQLLLLGNGRSLPSVRIAEISGQEIELDASKLDEYVGWYELSPYRVLTVTRAGDRMQVQETGRSQFEVAAGGADAFTGNHDDLVIFLRNDEKKVTKVLLDDPTSGAQMASRIPAVRAQSIEASFARRISEASDRFRDQTPAPGSKEAILRGIEDMRAGTPNYDRMSAALAAKARSQALQVQSMLKAFGAVESIFFRGVGPGGYDIYGLKFANGFAEIRILLGADGKTEDALFRPDGNEAPGGIAACSEEKGLRSLGETAPIKMQLFNDTGQELQLYRLDADGKRTAQGLIGDAMSDAVLTTVGTPWVITDTSGKCLEIVMPGQRTRFHSVEGPGVVRPPGQLSQRSAPQAGSEETLRQYILSVGRGEPNYNSMTPEVAAQTRQQLALDHAILNRLGPLRALSFRGVTGIGNDVYMAHFANGSAEWRIGLVKDGTIGRISLGPQS